MMLQTNDLLYKYKHILNKVQDKAIKRIYEVDSQLKGKWHDHTNMEEKS